jgi:putative ABC transport system ATP-binding protein
MKEDRVAEAGDPTGVSRDGALLVAEGLGRRSPKTGEWLVRDVAFLLRSGECVAVAGPTGSGKTVLLRALALLDPLDAGAVRWRGEPVPPADTPAFRSQVMYLHQRPALFPGTVEENLRAPFALRVHRGATPDRDRMLRLLEEAGRSGDFLDRQERDLSGGERQLVQLTRALLLDPAVLLLDEPTAALDSRTTSSVEGLVRRWLQESRGERALVWVSHDESQLGRMATRTVEVDHPQAQ